jgi:hypothetical protein
MHGVALACGRGTLAYDILAILWEEPRDRVDVVRAIVTERGSGVLAAEADA